MFQKLRVQRWLLEYDDERSGSFEPLSNVPEDGFVVLGLITTKKPEVESIDVLRRRVAAASRYIPMEQLGLSPQCGFASSIIGNNIAAEDQRRKLALVVKMARELWG